MPKSDYLDLTLICKNEREKTYACPTLTVMSYKGMLCKLSTFQNKDYQAVTFNRTG